MSNIFYKIFCDVKYILHLYVTINTIMTAFEILQQQAMSNCKATAQKMYALELQHVHGNKDAEADLKKHFGFTDKKLSARVKQLKKLI